MSMMDLAGALGDPNAPPPGEAPVFPGAEDQGAPPEGGGGDSMQFLDAAEEALHQFIQVDPDEVDRAEAGKALQIVLKLKATNQQSAEAGDMKSLRRALAPGGGGGGPVG